MSLTPSHCTDYRSDEWNWQRQEAADQLVKATIEEVASSNPPIAAWRRELMKSASCDLIHFLDHLALMELPIKALQQSGYLFDDRRQAWCHPGAQLPAWRQAGSVEQAGLFLRVDSLESCLQTYRSALHSIEGSPLAPYRRALLIKGPTHSLHIVERRGSDQFQPIELTSDQQTAVWRGRERWRLRERSLDDSGDVELGDERALQSAYEIAQDLSQALGPDVAASIVLEVEREYWGQRCLAGSIQKLRQDQLGLGWGNHDHHTFRCSRALFAKTISLFEKLGFHCRERFYAGKQAGWGAQVMENPRSGHILFLDVDLNPSELGFDFAHEGFPSQGFPSQGLPSQGLPSQGLPSQSTLGTIGLWCALHGDSILRSGMHHLEGQFLFQALQSDLQSWGVGFMKPFSELDYLHQAFSKPQYWPIDPVRLEQLRPKIDEEAYLRFATQGAIGSHLENLQRTDGYKGFNQKNVSEIIKETDPRHHQSG